MAQVLQGRVDVSALVSHVIAVSQVDRAYRLLDERPAEALQVVLDFGAGAGPAVPPLRATSG